MAMTESNLDAVREDLTDQFEIVKDALDEIAELWPSAVGWVKRRSNCQMLWMRK